MIYKIKQMQKSFEKKKNSIILNPPECMAVTMTNKNAQVSIIMTFSP